MKIGYLDCFSGISGDMLLGALVDVGVSLDTIRAALASLPFSGYELHSEKVKKAGIAATRVRVELKKEEAPHRGLAEVLSIIEQGALPKVGLDALMFSAVALGGGRAKSAHGTLPVPAPATAELLKGLPTYGGPVEMELTTPTGAALLKTLATPCNRWPEMRIEQVAYGAGARDIEGFPNVLRLVVGTRDTAEGGSDHIWLVETNLDDMTGEEVGFCTEKLLEAGALDVFITPIQMKKGRPGIKVTALCGPERLGELEAAIWSHTSTLGIRRSLWQRSRLRRTHTVVQTRWGEVTLKLACLGGRTVRCKPEYEDCRRIAEAHGVPLRQVYLEAKKAFQERQPQ